jgi:heme/copper-type cytochrome/quinol oxidase subunit 2
LADGGSVNLKDFNPIKENNIYGLIKSILDFVVKIGAVVVVFYIIYAGFLFVTAQGNEEKISSAKKAFLWTVIGALILLGAMTLSGVVCNTANQLGANVSCG